jgi:2-oxoglutarate dehydrogenase E1 component
MSNSLKDQYASSPLFGSNAAAIEALYEQFIENPDTVLESWRHYFRSLGDGQVEIAHTPIRRRLLEKSRAGNGNGQTTA